MARLLIFLLVFCSGSAFAICDDTLALGTINWSKHKEAADNESHYGVYLNCNNYILGRYINSYGHSSNLVGYEAAFWAKNSLELAFTVLAADNYPYEDTQYMVSPMLSVQYKYIKALANPEIIVFGFVYDFK